MIRSEADRARSEKGARTVPANVSTETTSNSDDDEPSWAAHLPDGMDWRDVDLLAAGSLPAAWVRRWTADPDRVVVHDDETGWLTGADLLQRSARVAGRLAGAGLSRGDRVLLSGPATCDFVIAHVAALRAGLVVIPVNSSFTPHEMAVLIEASQPAGAVLGSAPLRDAARTSDSSRHKEGLVVTDITVDLPDGPTPPLDVVGPSDPALLPYTSGTTGQPKGVLLSHGNLLASAEAVRIAWRWTDADCLILALPLFHVHGLGVGLHGALLTGSSIVLQDRFEPELVLAAAAEATMFFGVPTMYARLVEAPGAERLGSLRLCVAGSAPLSGALHEQIRGVSGQTVLERYGMTETIMLVSNPYDGERRPGSVGIPLPGVDLRLDSTDGTSGEILVKGPNVFSGYLSGSVAGNQLRADANGTAFDADGWFRTGDIGQFDDDGYLRIVGRSKELIISGGFNVYPREVEDVLRDHPSVRDVAVVGTPSAEWGEIVTAFVETDDETLDTEALSSWAASRLVRYKQPRIFHRIDELPRNKLGKVVRGELVTPES
jgi:malonyl-CoA/methylmalonyl-CoA synthetase